MEEEVVKNWNDRMTPGSDHFPELKKMCQISTLLIETMPCLMRQLKK